MQVVRASVKPHAISLATGEVLALEDAIASWIERDARGVILIRGDEGSGRTTAIRHLAAVLPPKPHIRLLDQGDSPPNKSDSYAKGLLLIKTEDRASEQFHSGTNVLAEYHLAGWTMDDVIEYLVGQWPDRCASVVARLNAPTVRGENAALEGRPSVWRVALDRMAKDDLITSPVEAVLQEIEVLAGSAERLRVFQDFCLIAATEPMRGPTVRKFNNTILRLMAPRAILQTLATDRVIAYLKEDDEHEGLYPTLPASIVKQVGALADESVVARLKSIFTDPKSGSLRASAAGILVAADPRWRPEKRTGLDLSQAVLDGVSWDGIKLTVSCFACASLVNADLKCADLMLAKMEFADLRGSDLREANLTCIDAVQANFSQADLRIATIQSANLTFACLEDAILDGAKLDNATLRGANFRQASFRNAFLGECDLKHAHIEGADFSGANFDAADLDDLPLCKASLTDASFYGASLRRCDLELIDPGSSMDFRAACLMGAHLTGAQLPNARFANADLRATGLADINLEGADLQNVRLCGATFHMGSSRSGLVDSPIASEGTRTGFYTDEYEEKHYRDPEEVRKANLCGADLLGAKVENADFYLVDLRGARFSQDQRDHFERCGAILD
jgi:uncharacterized protein YjbI with pentapeptide repeats